MIFIGFSCYMFLFKSYLADFALTKQCSVKMQVVHDYTDRENEEQKQTEL